MNSAAHGSVNLGQDATMVQSNGTGYTSDHWASISPYSQSPYGNSPLNEYGATFGGFISHGLPSESLGRMPPPIHPPTTHQLIQPAPLMGHHQLPMLNTQWPSQLTNPTPSGSYSAPPLSIAPASSLPPVDLPPRPPVHHEKARKTLSAEQKRAMCLYHEENPGTRQADIGAKFGVERSTVSKVLRHKDQYLKRDPEQDSAALKRMKGKHPDFDRTLSNYVRRQLQRGFEVKDDEILEQARLFARAGGNQEGGLTHINSNWLLKFKQKHGIGAGRLMRRASETNIPDSITMSTASTRRSRDKTASNTISPVSPTQRLSPFSASRSDEDLQAEGHDFDFHYGHAGSHSSTSLASDLRDSNVSFSGDAMSPTAPFHFSPDPNVGAFQNTLHIQPSATDLHHRGKRSNTFPSLNIDCVNQDTSADPLTPRHSAVTASSAVESPTNDIRSTPFTLDTAVSSPPALRRTSSNSSIAVRSNNTSANPSSGSSTAADSSPTSPTPEDARRAAETLLNYLHSMVPNGAFDKSEYATIVQLTKKLQIHQHQTTRPSIGGLSRIPEGDDGEAQSLAEAAMEEA